MSLRLTLLLGTLILAVQALVLALFGQPPICECGYVKFWEGVVSGPGNSQHLTDWYTFSHIIHGFLFYLLLRYLFPQLTVAARMALALGIEVAWEVLENTPMVINHYRQQALAQGYVGDSIINSISDTLAMAGGFIAAWRLPIVATVFAALGLELIVGYLIHDNLALNILNFIYPLEFITNWQAGS